MPFDFPNYTYSGLLSFVTVLFSFAYPKIIDSIADVDKGYRSTLLSARYKRESSFLIFRILLVVNIIISVVIPFLMYGSEHAHIYIIVQGVCTACLITSTFCMFHTIMFYKDPIVLHQAIWDKYRRLLNSTKKNNKEVERSFSEWVELSKTVLTSGDQNAARKVHEGWYEYITVFYKNHKADNVDYDQYFYDGLTRLNETLCQMPDVPISVNNGNDILTSLFLLDKSVTQTTYIMLWRNLRIQLFYGKDDWIMEYWTQASQKYELFMQKVSVYEMNNESGERYTQGEVERRNHDRWIFLRFHIMLCAMILNMGKYNLLSRMLNFTQSQPPHYPLVPSDISTISLVFHHLNKDNLNEPFIFETMFQMPGLNGISEGKIQGAANEYLSLLVFRIYNLILPYGANEAMQPMYLPQQLDELREIKNTMNTLLYWIKKTKQNKRLLEVVDVINWDNTLKIAQSKYGSAIIDPETVITKLITNIHDNITELKMKLPYDDSKVNEITESITGLVKKGLEDYDVFLEMKQYPNKTTYWVDGSIYTLYPNAAFVEKPDISYVNIPESTSACILGNFRNYFGSTFEKTFISLASAKTYNIDFEDVLACIDRLTLDVNQVVISFGIYWDFYIDRHADFKKNDDANFRYKNVNIIKLKSDSPFVCQNFYVLNKTEIPYLTFEEPDENLKLKYNYKKFDEKYGLWLSLQKVYEHPDLISDNERNQMKDNPNEQSVFAAFLLAKCHWKNDITMVKVQVKHKLIDNGNIDDVNLVKPFY